MRQQLALAAVGKKVPLLLGLGVHKSATTFLWSLLKDSPRLVPGFRKETGMPKKELYALAEFPFPLTTLEWYLDRWGSGWVLFLLILLATLPPSLGLLTLYQ